MGSCGMTVMSDIDDDSATKHGKFHRKKNSGLSHVTFSEGLVSHVEPSFFRLTVVEITQDDAHSVGVSGPMRRNEMQSFP